MDRTTVVLIAQIIVLVLAIVTLTVYGVSLTLTDGCR